MEPNEFGAAVLHRRKKLRLSQTALAERAGLSRNYLSLLETGRAVNPSYDIVRRLSRVLALETFDKPERTSTASCYLCQTGIDLHMIPHRKDGYLVGWIFSCADCAPKLWGTELTAAFPEQLG